jgi:ACDE family multidrug resistance protein
LDKKLNATIGILCLVPFIMVLGNSMLIPVLPSIQKELHLSSVQSGLLITMFSIPAGLVIPFAGVFSDWIGRKRIMFPALLVYGSGGILAGIAAVVFNEQAFVWILGARIIQGIGAGGTYQLSMALVGDLIQSGERSKALGMLEAANGIGKVVSPLAGAALALISWYTPFFIYGILAWPIAFLINSVVKEDLDLRQQQQKLQPLRQYFQKVGQQFIQKWLPLTLAFLSGLLVMFSLFGLLSFYADLLEVQFKMGVFSRGLILAVPVLVMTIIAYVLGAAMQKQPARMVKWGVVGGLFLVAAGLILFCPCKNLALLMLTASLLGAGTGAVLPALNTLITSAAPKTERGVITCLYGTVRFFGVAIGPPIFGFAHKITKPPVFITTAGICFGLSLLFWFFVHPSQLMSNQLQSSK